MIDHMSRDCPTPRQNNYGGGGNQGRRTERDTISGTDPLPPCTTHAPFILSSSHPKSLASSQCPCSVLMIGGHVTSNEPLPTWEPVETSMDFNGGGGGGS